jgi:hypothetical protein
MEKEMSKGFDLGLGSFGITLLVVAGVLLM